MNGIRVGFCRTITFAVALPFLVLACSLLSGCCVGGLAVYSETKTFEHFSLGPKDDFRPETKGENPTEAKVQELWGKPDSKRNEKDGVVVWRYKGVWSWAGLVPMPLIPVPLVVPTGHDYIDIYIKDGVAVKAHMSITYATGAGMGPSSNGFHKMHEPFTGGFHR
jgi:hypothetical protein